MSQISNLKLSDRIIAATVLRLIPHWIKPNHITIVRFITVPIIFWFLLKEQYGWGVTFFAASAFTDALDGTCARVRNQCSDWGRLLDPVADKLLIGVAGGVLICRFLDVYLLAAVLFIEILLITNGYIQKEFHNKIISSHPSGKIKMLLQSFGMIGLFGYAAMGGGVILLSIIYGIFYIAILFGVVSLVVYKSI